MLFAVSSSLLQYLRVLAATWETDPRSDVELLACFAEAHDERAFTVLVGRHGPMVWRVCRSLLKNGPDAEDAFQATFFLLARKAGGLRREALAGWLHRVAHYTALKVRTAAERRRRLERHTGELIRLEAAQDTQSAELYALLNEELAGLPERLRVPLVLRYLEGKTLAEVAQILGCSLTTVTKRLGRGEAILRERLTGRGLVVGSVSALLTSSVAVSAVPARLIGSTARAAIAFRFGTLTGGVAEGARRTLRLLSSPQESSTSAALAEGVMKTMLVTKMKLVTVLLGLTLCLAGGGLLAYQALAGNATEPSQPASETRGEAEASGQPRATARVDCFGDPLPACALARMGTTRLYNHGNGMYPSTALAFSPDGKTLATHIDGMTVCLWDAATGKEIRRLTTKAVKEGIVSLGFSPDGKTLVTVTWEQTVCRWEVATGKFLRKQQYQGPKRNNVQSLTVAFLSDGQMLGFADFWKSVKQGEGAYVWDVTTGKEICQLSESRKRERSIVVRAFSADGKLLATAVSEDKRAIISLWDVATGKEIRRLTYEGSVETVAFSRDGKTLASEDRNREKICIWEIATGKPIHLLEAGRGSYPLLTYSPDGKTLVGGREGHLWDVGTGKEIRSFGWKDAQVALFSPNGKILAVEDNVGAIRLWEVATGKEIGPRKGFRGGIRSVAYSPDGKTLASMGWGETVRLWEVATGKEMRQLAKGSRSVAYSPDGKMLVSTMDDGIGALHLWDMAIGTEIRHFQPHATNVNPWSVTFSPDGKKLAAGGVKDDNQPVVYLWEVATGKEIYSLPAGVAGLAQPWLAAFSPDSRLLAAPGKDNMVSLWEMATGQRIGQLGGPKPPAQRPDQVVQYLAFSPDGRMLATSGMGDDKVHLWEIATGKEIWQLDRLQNGRLEACPWAFSPDGRMFATAAQGHYNRPFDPKVRLWEVASGKEIGQLSGHRAPVRTIAFSSDGKTLASGSDDLTCLIWDVTSFGGRLKPVPARPLPVQILSQEQLEAAWTDLAKDPAKAYAAIWTLQAVPTQAIPLLRERVRPIAPPADPQQLKRWIADLDANSFTVRDKAQREIEKLGEVAIPALRQALKDRRALEVKRRLKDLLAELEPKVVGGSPRCLRELRAVQVLESIGTAEARRVLQTWAKGLPGARLTVEAESALARLAKRSAAKP